MSRNPSEVGAAAPLMLDGANKKAVVALILKESRPGPGMSQWVVVYETKRLAENLGLLKLEWYAGTRLEWSGSLSVAIDGRGKDNLETGTKWKKIPVGKSGFNVLTFELRGKTFMENVSGFFKRSFDGAKMQDFLPFGKK